MKSLSIPNAFSPNGDGINDLWLIPTLQTYSNCRVEIYNRYGQPVFESSGYSKPWDGTFKGNPLPTGTYYFIIDAKNGNKPYTGYVALIK
jgi:gliding motility-associated-like protein